MSKENQEKPLWVQRMAHTKEQRRFIWGHIKRNSKLINLFGALYEVGMRSEKYRDLGVVAAWSSTSKFQDSKLPAL